MGNYLLQSTLLVVILSDITIQPSETEDEFRATLNIDAVKKPDLYSPNNSRRFTTFQTGQLSFESFQCLQQSVFVLQIFG